MVVTFTEYALRQEYSNLIDQWEQMRLHDGFVVSEGIMQAAGRGLISLSSAVLNLAKKKADQLMSMGMEKLQSFLASKGHPNLLAKLNKYKNGLMILGIIAAGGLMALSGGKTLSPDSVNDALQLPRGTYEQMDKDVQNAVMQGAEGKQIKTAVSASEDADEFFQGETSPRSQKIEKLITQYQKKHAGDQKYNLKVLKFQGKQKLNKDARDWAMSQLRNQ